MTFNNLEMTLRPKTTAPLFPLWKNLRKLSNILSSNSYNSLIINRNVLKKHKKWPKMTLKWPLMTFKWPWDQKQRTHYVCHEKIFKSCRTFYPLTLITFFWFRKSLFLGVWTVSSTFKRVPSWEIADTQIFLVDNKILVNNQQ